VAVTAGLAVFKNRDFQSCILRPGFLRFDFHSNCDHGRSALAVYPYGRVLDLGLIGLSEFRRFVMFGCWSRRHVAINYEIASDHQCLVTVRMQFVRLRLLQFCVVESLRTTLPIFAVLAFFLRR